MVIRHLASISLIAIYLAMVVGGDVFHQLQHMVADGACFGHSAGSTLSSDEETKNRCSHSHAKHLSDFGSENEHLLGADSPVNHEQEDSSSDCWTCYVLAQAGDISFEITIDVSHHFVYFAAATYEHWHLPLNTHKFLVRGPPEIHSPTS
ncbi:MAG: hypothetical protein ACJZ8Y_06615 [Pirellulaceae bacterium]